jgi:transposase-like protein
MKVAKRHGISEQTIYTWRKRFGVLCRRATSSACGSSRRRMRG